nr:immunoglobulin light chain junction region [Macaca mulatta]MOX33184.1 immunoglobulin light chain junction region [Macaca mulatta]MOX33193.1 immunoglobulin light chain junction region [Macaca mulatta]MOX33201.1 immunoglobulin light chain junction region [Macaca mulatta]MOX33233.1 immunoglobulin light chain junction region [Macaca mulatta]
DYYCCSYTSGSTWVF